MIEVGQRYQKIKWADSNPFKDDWRSNIFEVRSITLTHIYIFNVRLRYSINVPISVFTKSYALCSSDSQ